MVANSLTMDDVRWCGLQGALCGGDISGVHYTGIIMIWEGIETYLSIYNCETFFMYKRIIGGCNQGVVKLDELI